MRFLRGSEISFDAVTCCCGMRVPGAHVVTAPSCMLCRGAFAHVVERTEKLVNILVDNTEHVPINMDNLLLRESMDVIGAPPASTAPFSPELKAVAQRTILQTSASVDYSVTA